MVFDNQSIEMHIAVLVLCVIGTLSTILATAFQGVFLNEIRIAVRANKPKNQTPSTANASNANGTTPAAQFRNKWAGPAAYGLGITAAVLLTFVTLYLGFDLETRIKVDRVRKA